MGASRRSEVAAGAQAHGATDGMLLLDGSEFLMGSDGFRVARDA